MTGHFRMLQRIGNRSLAVGMYRAHWQEQKLDAHDRMNTLGATRFVLGWFSMSLLIVGNFRSSALAGAAYGVSAAFHRSASDRYAQAVVAHQAFSDGTAEKLDAEHFESLRRRFPLPDE